jgi:hypothetical protein
VQHFVTEFRKQRLGMELDAFERQLPVAQAHDFPVFRLRGDRQAPRQRFAFDNE